MEHVVLVEGGVDGVRELKTVSELAIQYGVHPMRSYRWKRELLTRAEELFKEGDRRPRDCREHEALQTQLNEEIPRLKVQLEWIRRIAAQFEWHEVRDGGMGSRRAQFPTQRELLALNRSTFCHQGVGESDENLRLMEVINAQY